MPGRQSPVIAGDEHRYGFQGQELDDEVKGHGNSVNYKYRMHDPRVGRFFAVDPLAPQYPHNSPYAFSENRVIDGLELEGLEVQIFHFSNGKYFEVALGSVSKTTIEEFAKKQRWTYVGYYTGDRETYFTPYGKKTTLAEITKQYAVPDNYPTFKETTKRKMEEGKRALEVQKTLALMENTQLGDFAKIGQGLLHGPEAAATVFLPEIAIAKFLKYVPQAQKAISTIAEYTQSFKPINEYDPIVTLYRGTTGSEGTGTILFTAENSAVAGSYIKNGGSLVEYNVSLSSLRTLEASGQLTIRTGIHGAEGQVTREFVFEGKNLKEALNSIAKQVNK